MTPLTVSDCDVLLAMCDTRVDSGDTGVWDGKMRMDDGRDW